MKNTMREKNLIDMIDPLQKRVQDVYVYLRILAMSTVGLSIHRSVFNQNKFHILIVPVSQNANQTKLYTMFIRQINRRSLSLCLFVCLSFFFCLSVSVCPSVCRSPIFVCHFLPVSLCLSDILCLAVSLSFPLSLSSWG